MHPTLVTSHASNPCDIPCIQPFSTPLGVFAVLVATCGPYSQECVYVLGVDVNVTSGRCECHITARAHRVGCSLEHLSITLESCLCNFVPACTGAWVSVKEG